MSTKKLVNLKNFHKEFPFKLDNKIKYCINRGMQYFKSYRIKHLFFNIKGNRNNQISPPTSRFRRSKKSVIKRCLSLASSRPLLVSILSFMYCSLTKYSL